MSIYAGEAVTVKVQAVDPLTNAIISGGVVGKVEFYAPPKDPKNVVADRVVDKGPFALAFNATAINKDGTVGAYVAFVDTTGWAPGKWNYKATLTGSYNAWEFGSVVLKT